MLLNSNVLLYNILKISVEKRASNIHLSCGCPPVYRIDGEIATHDGLCHLTGEEMEAIFIAMTTPAQREAFAQELELSFMYTVPELARFRVSALKQRGTIALSLRLVPFNVLSIDGLGLPQILKKLVLKPRGLILVTGHTGSGKSTTLAAMIDYLNEKERRNVVTIEDPIEFLHDNKKCVITQRDVGIDTKSFANALKHVLRQDPDTIVVGEMRDLETMAAAITAAETGHLVMATLHTLNATQSIDRIIDVFPPSQQGQIRFQLSLVMEAVLSQVLLRRVGGGRIAALEIMISTPAVRNLIREGKTYQLPSMIQLGSKDGMQTLHQALADLVKRHLVTPEEALAKSSDPDELRKLF